MRCDQSSLNAYLDGELPSDQLAVVHEHIGSCPDCAVEIAELVRLRRSVRLARGHFVPSADFRQRIRQQVAAPKRRNNVLRWIPAAIAAAVLFLVFLGWAQYSHRADTLTEVADLHVNALASTNPLDVISTDRHTVKPWFQGRVPFSFNVPELAGSEFTLLGGRLIYLHRQPAAQLLVAMKQHKISVLIVQESPELARAFPLAGSIRDRNSFGVETWRSRELRFFVIGDTDPAEIGQLANRLKQAND
jgi:anti-sigma factor RsiW